MILILITFHFIVDVYEAFLAQLQSADKVIFSLNMERPTFLKVQFLYPDQPSNQNRESAMLVFLHKECEYLHPIKLYHLKRPSRS